MSDPENGLAFLQSLSGRLTIELTEPPEPVSELLQNLAAKPTAGIARLAFELDVYDEELDDHRALTDDEWALVVIRAPTIRMQSSEGGPVVEHRAGDGISFRVRDIARAIEATELEGRPHSKWLGGIDVHHVYFEGIEEQESGIWWIQWGS